MEFDHEIIAKRVIELSGGKEKLNEEMDLKLARVNEKWNQDVGAIGRILRGTQGIPRTVYLTRKTRYCNLRPSAGEPG